jgi:integrase
VIKDVRRRGIAIDDPFAKGEFDVPKPAESDVFLEFGELQSMMALVDTLPLGSRKHRVLVMYLFACVTGLRIVDTMKLTWGDLNLDNDKMHLKKVAQKTRRGFIAPIFDSAAQLLVMSIEDINNVEADNKVFYPYSGTTINNTLKELAVLADVDKPISFHSARRTCATLLAAADVSPVFIRDMLGHKSLKMTDSYIKTSETLMALKAKDIDVFSAARLGLDKQ